MCQSNRIYDLVVAFKRLFKRTVHALPAPVRYFLTIVAFWPTALINRVYCYWLPHKRRIWDRITDHVILGAAPFYRGDLEKLYHQEGVRGVVNMCKEWDAHKEWYPTLGIRQLWLPTIDYDTPHLEHCLAGAQFIREHELRGETVYVHCKAGRGRSTTIVLCYLVMFKGLTPHQADLYTRQFRPHISQKYDEADVRQCYEIGMQNKHDTYGLISFKGEPYSAAAIAALAREISEGRVVEPTRSHMQADSQDNIPTTMRQDRKND